MYRQTPLVIIWFIYFKKKLNKSFSQKLPKKKKKALYTFWWMNLSNLEAPKEHALPYSNNFKIKQIKYGLGFKWDYLFKLQMFWDES